MRLPPPHDPPAESGRRPVRPGREPLDFDRPSAPVRPLPDRPALRRMRRRRRRTVALLLVLLAAGGATTAVTGLPRRVADDSPAAADRSRPAADDAPRAADAPVPEVEAAPDGVGAGGPSAYPTVASGRFTAAGGGSPVRGTAGPLRRYRVAVEAGAGQDADAFAATVDEVLGDPRSWIGSGELRVQRVAEEAAADFTVYLATPATSERICAEGGLTTERYTSCRLPGRVVVNLARWMEAVPDYGAPVDTYRKYVINHEVGHEFGEEHQACPGPGEPAPVMQQQTYGLDGCVANAWPYVAGARYAGEPVAGI
ncbi:DUF3152 domain-containing protein [Micromonospora sp. R77]|uniref:DUF3152 domain-containing protein n=1 Tax=Micromonospora sp. R77 TaxID=2925836 RepID=UPI001F61328A|nr:DUF3152 domain-containing protein [Micromonospora sp. R77]MCI4062835.1 DUF3152 domain-containing protein [Micromonospora sp. R77]